MPRSQPTTVIFLVRVRVRGDQLEPTRLPCHSVAADIRRALRKEAPHIQLEAKGAVRASRVLLPEREVMNWRLWQREVDMKLQSRGEDATRLYRFCMEERALFMKLLDYLGLEIADPPPPSPAIVIRKKKTARNR